MLHSTRCGKWCNAYHTSTRFGSQGTRKQHSKTLPRAERHAKTILLISQTHEAILDDSTRTHFIFPLFSLHHSALSTRRIWSSASDPALTGLLYLCNTLTGWAYIHQVITWVWTCPPVLKAQLSPRACNRRYGSVMHCTRTVAAPKRRYIQNFQFKAFKTFENEEVSRLARNMAL